MFNTELYQFYADNYAFAARSGLERAISIFAGINIAASVDIKSIPNIVNAAGAIADFTRALDLSYEYLWSDGQNLNYIKTSFEALANWVKHETGFTVSDYIVNEGIQVDPTYANISNLLGEPILDSSIST